MIAALAFKNMLHRPLNTLLSGILLTVSVAMISLLLLLKSQLQQKFEVNIAGVDLVMGAKGSPLQLILSSVYHLDYPTGNIKYTVAQRWMNNPMVESAIPLAYGDNVQGFAIVGTTIDYLEKYGAQCEQGVFFQQPFEVVVGCDVAQKLSLSVGSIFHGTHGGDANGEQHDAHPYRVTGVLARSGTVVDHLVVTPLESVWLSHEVHESPETDPDDDEATQEHHKDGHNNEHHGEGEQSPSTADREITAVLFKFRGPMPIVLWPRLVAEQGNLQVAAPVIELNRLFSLLGIGLDALIGLGWVVMALAALSVFIALYNTLKDRRYELALMRTLGASRIQLMGLLLLESLWLCLIGFTCGILVSRLALWIISGTAASAYHLWLDQFGLLVPEEVWLLLLTLLIGLLAAFIPALKAYRLDISTTLSSD
jgi:putative ABC transport system permease protein